MPDIQELLSQKAALEEKIAEAKKAEAENIGKEAQRYYGTDVSSKEVITGLCLLKLAEGEAPDLLEKAKASAERFLPKKRGRRRNKTQN